MCACLCECREASRVWSLQTSANRQNEMLPCLETESGPCSQESVHRRARLVLESHGEEGGRGAGLGHFRVSGCPRLV